MSTGQHTITLVLITFFLATGCRKDSTEPSVPAPSYIAAQVDSAFIQAPNVMTPNADGINDLFSVSARNMVSLRTTIERMNGDTVFWSDSMYPVWAGPVPITLGGIVSISPE
ncbi:MAG: gliding motility-associated C-terminal domain-containing protein [Flavobacteriales bacterium]|nr:gliding motility-associated C-terminal domain-containing protein [Flavobacteriales bacterium]